MFNKNKGEYGYIQEYKKIKLVFSLIFGGLILGIIIALLILFKTTKTVYVVIPILLSLPFAKNIIGLFMCIKYKSLKTEDYTRIQNSLKNEIKECMLYDVVISHYEGMHYYDCICLRNGKVYAYISKKPDKAELKNYEKWIYESIYDGKNEIVIKIFDNMDQFIKKTNIISEPNHNTALVDKHMREVILTYCV